MKVEIIVPEEYIGEVIGDINSRRGKIEGIEPKGGSQVTVSYTHLFRSRLMLTVRLFWPLGGW